MDLSGFKGIELHVQGDHQTYQLRLKTDAKRVTYAHSFKTTDEWQHLRLSFADFEPTHRGEPVPDAPELNRSTVRMISFLIGDKQEGEFGKKVKVNLNCSLTEMYLQATQEVTIGSDRVWNEQH